MERKNKDMSSSMIIRDETVDEFLKHVNTLLYSDEPTNSLMLGLCGNLQRAKDKQKEDPFFLRIVRDNKTQTCVLQTPPMNLILTYAEKGDIDN